MYNNTESVKLKRRNFLRENGGKEKKKKEIKRYFRLEKGNSHRS